MIFPTNLLENNHTQVQSIMGVVCRKFPAYFQHIFIFSKVKFLRLRLLREKCVRNIQETKRKLGLPTLITIFLKMLEKNKTSNQDLQRNFKGPSPKRIFLPLKCQKSLQNIWNGNGIIELINQSNTDSATESPNKRFTSLIISVQQTFLAYYLPKA